MRMCVATLSVLIMVVSIGPVCGYSLLSDAEAVLVTGAGNAKNCDHNEGCRDGCEIEQGGPAGANYMLCSNTKMVCSVSGFWWKYCDNDNDWICYCDYYTDKIQEFECDGYLSSGQVTKTGCLWKSYGGDDD